MPRVNPSSTDDGTLLPILEAGLLSTLRSVFGRQARSSKSSCGESTSSWEHITVDLLTHPCMNPTSAEMRYARPMRSEWKSLDPSTRPRVSEEVDMKLFERTLDPDNGSDQSSCDSGYSTGNRSTFGSKTVERSAPPVKPLPTREMKSKTVRKITRFDSCAPSDRIGKRSAPSDLSSAIPQARLSRKEDTNDPQESADSQTTLLQTKRPSELSFTAMCPKSIRIPRARLLRKEDTNDAQESADSQTTLLQTKRPSELSCAAMCPKSIRIPRARLRRKDDTNDAQESADSPSILLRTKRKSVNDVKRAARRRERRRPHATLKSAADAYQSLWLAIQKKFSERKSSDLSTTQMRIISLVRTVRAMKDTRSMDILSRVWGALHPPTNISCLEFPSIWTRQVLDPPVSDGTAKADLKMFFLLPDDDNYLAIALSLFFNLYKHHSK
ncbi:MAG: hypothetical protein KVP17_000882 [Porospora cf. gigantea B]|uniref:uncharacterized protein n=1 Tax=Porospora cf. gigantea B TaxID=2853592 RepID=UPI003571A659|nr:MAG: hypothetical protein KVP17_000882 [Porospora cf. gigantea B]